MGTIVRPAITIFLVITVVTGVVYPLAVTGFAQLFFPGRSNGSIIWLDGTPVGSTLIGQDFENPKYLWGRPSVTTPAPYNAAASTGSNLGPTNPALRQEVTERVAMLRAADLENAALIPVDLVTASGSGLDPHISPAAARYQATRIARTRGIPEESVREAIDRCAKGRQFGLLGEPRVNVLCVNLALDGNVRAGSD